MICFLFLDIVPPNQADITPSGFAVRSTAEPAMTGCAVNPADGFRASIEVLNVPQNEMPVGDAEQWILPKPDTLLQNNPAEPVLRNYYPPVSPPEPPQTIVPEPAAVAVFAAGLLVLFLLWFGRHRLLRFLRR